MHVYICMCIYIYTSASSRNYADVHVLRAFVKCFQIKQAETLNFSKAPGKGQIGALGFAKRFLENLREPKSITTAGLRAPCTRTYERQLPLTRSEALARICSVVT